MRILASFSVIPREQSERTLLYFYNLFIRIYEGKPHRNDSVTPTRRPISGPKRYEILSRIRRQHKHNVHINKSFLSLIFPSSFGSFFLCPLLSSFLSSPVVDLLPLPSLLRASVQLSFMIINRNILFLYGYSRNCSVYI